MSAGVHRQLTMEEKLREMSLFEFITAFGSITDQDAEADTFKERIPFALWPRQAEACLFMETVQNVLLPKSRQKGYSEISAERCLLTLFSHKNVKGAVVSKSEDFAKAYLTDRILPKYKEMTKNHPGKFPKIIKDNKDEIEWEGGRKLLSISCSNTGAASLTLDFMVFDEAGGIDKGAGKSFENSLFKSILHNSMPALDQNPRSWSMIIGTSEPGTYYNKLVREAYDNNNTGEYKYFFIGWWHQPGRNEAWYLKQVQKLGNDVRLQHPTDMDDFFFVKDGLVFPHFDAREGGKHVFDFEIGTPIIRKVRKGLKYNIQKFRPSWNLEFFTVYDHGTNHAACNLYFLYDVYSDMLFVFDEVFFQDGHGSSVPEIEAKLKEKVRDYPIPRKPDKEVADGAIFNDIGVESVGKLFKKLGRSFRKAKKHDESASRELLNARFRDNKIIIHPSCTNFIAQLKGYLWDASKLIEKPIQKADDSIDCARYGCMECKPQAHAIKERPRDSYEMKVKENEFQNRNYSQSGEDWQSW